MNNEIEIPFLLSEAIKSQRAVVVVGAGCSKECQNINGDSPPDGNQLRDVLATKFLGTKNDQRDLMTVAELASTGGAGQPAVFDEIENMFHGFETSEAHKKLPQFFWRALVTTNYDLFIEDAYSAVQERKQKCVSFVKDREPYDDRLRRMTNPIPLLKLHGCLNHRLDNEIPLVLSHEHYQRVSSNRTKLLEKFQHWATDSPIIFIGYKINDPHIRNIIYNIEPNSRPQWYVVTPGADEHDRRFWASKNIQTINATFGQFMLALEDAIPPIARNISYQSDDASPAPYRMHFRTNSPESYELRKGMEDDFEYVHSGVSFTEKTAKLFYSGYDDGWCGIIRKYDFKRKRGEDLLYEAVDENDKKSGLNFFLLQGPAGAGKSIALRRMAFDAATALDSLVLWLRPGGVPRFSVIKELHDMTGKSPIIFADSASMNAKELKMLMDEVKSEKIPMTLVSAEREADWNTYCADLEENYSPEIFKLGHLSEFEANELIDLLARHNCLGKLSEQPRDKQVESFMDTKRSARQLLVALHELTQGVPFEDIIKDEFQRISDDIARSLYLDIATMHQFGAPARAGLISRISGIGFRQFESEFFEPLKDIVIVRDDYITGDKIYTTRHPKVAELVFGQACQSDQSKSTQFKRIIEGIDPSYSSDAFVLNGVCKGRKIANQFGDISFGREIFEMANRAAPNEAFLYHQHAVMEYTHNHGSLDRSEEAANKARELDGKNHVFINTQAEIARRKAKVASEDAKKDYLRKQARMLLGEIWTKNAYTDGTYCKLLVDEVIDLTSELSENASDHIVIAFDTKLSEATDRISKASQDYPEEAEIKIIESNLWEALNSQEKAVKALRKAIQAKPRSSGTYIRLARIYRSNNNIDACLDMLDQALEIFPEDKHLHLEMAAAIIQNIGLPHPDIEMHLNSSYTVGDNNYDARYMHGQYMFWAGEPEKGQEIFEELDLRAPETYRTRKPQKDDLITSRMSEYSGIISSKKARFVFIRSGNFKNEVFTHRSDFLEGLFDEVSIGDSVNFKVRFDRRGPVAVSVRRSQR